MDISGMSAIVTGGGTGVGRATALALAADGAHVAIIYNSSEKEAHLTADAIASQGGRCLVIQANVADDAACRNMVQRTVDAFGRLDILVNNAAVTRFINHDKLEEVTQEIWSEIFAVNVHGPFQCIRAAVPHFTHGKGIVVNVASTAGITGIGSSIPYCASKAALINMTTALARALAPHVRVNAVAPGFIRGRWLEQGLGQDYETVKRSWESRAALEKVCEPGDVASAIMSFITGSQMVTGQTLVCDGGMMIGKARL